MAKYKEILVFLSCLVFICDAWMTTPYYSLSPKPYKCFENPGSCPFSSTKCNLPIPIRQNGIQSCKCDSECQPNNKCCVNPCFIYKTCQPKTNMNDIALERDINALKKLQDYEIKQIVHKNANNYFYNIIKNIYVQNLNIYNGPHTKDFKQNDRIPDIEIKTKEVDPHKEVEHTDIREEHTDIREERTDLREEHDLLEERTTPQQEHTGPHQEHTAPRQEHTTPHQETLVPNTDDEDYFDSSSGFSSGGGFIPEGSGHQDNFIDQQVEKALYKASQVLRLYEDNYDNSRDSKVDPDEFDFS